MKLYLVRHLAPLIDAGVCYGRSDLDTDPTAQTLALPALRAQLPASAALYASPLRRCAALAKALHGAPRFDPRLVELDFGAWEMQRWEHIARAEVDAWAADMAAYRPGGGESVLDMARRVMAFHDDLISSGLPVAVVVCHAGTIRLLAARQRGLAAEEMARAAAARPHAIGYGEVLVLDRV